MHVPELSPEAPLKTDAHHLQRADHCLNCGTAVSANYCPNCGQETVLHVPSAGEFLHEFIGHYVALEGKLWKSLGLLLFKPGRLTREYLEGRRVRYVLPLRLYLTFSIIFFALFKYGAQSGHTDSAPQERPAAVAQQPAAEPKAARAAAINIDPEDREISKKLADIAPEVLKPKLAKLDGMSLDELKHAGTVAFFSYVPYAVFALMPVFALYLKLLYLGSGRRYGEHLLFALHTNAFAFLLLCLLLVTPASVPFLHGLLGIWLVFYLPTAMRKVYGGSRLATFGRWMVLGALHLFTLMGAVLGAMAIGVILS